MVRTLDARSSLGSNGVPQFNLPMAHNTPVLIGIVGLNISNPGSFIRTQFSGTVGITVNALYTYPAALRLEIFRGADYQGQPIYAASCPILPVYPYNLASFDGSDYNVPPPNDGQLIYSCYATYLPVGNTDEPIRVGPESFNAVAYCD